MNVKPGTALSVMNELFEINTVLEIDAQTGLPTKEKMADLTVVMKDNKTVIGQTKLNMANLNFDIFKYQRLKFVPLLIEGRI